MTTKFCTGCKAERELLEFNRSARMKDGLQSRCKSCNREAMARWYAKNIERNRLRWAAEDAAKESGSGQAQG